MRQAIINYQTNESDIVEIVKYANK